MHVCAYVSIYVCMYCMYACMLFVCVCAVCVPCVITVCVLHASTCVCARACVYIHVCMQTCMCICKQDDIQHFLQFFHETYSYACIDSYLLHWWNLYVCMHPFMFVTLMSAYPCVHKHALTHSDSIYVHTCIKKHYLNHANIRTLSFSLTPRNTHDTMIFSCE
jgi:hypothetical protein